MRFSGDKCHLFSCTVHSPTRCHFASTVAARSCSIRASHLEHWAAAPHKEIDATSWRVFSRIHRDSAHGRSMHRAMWCPALHFDAIGNGTSRGVWSLSPSCVPAFGTSAGWAPLASMLACTAHDLLQKSGRVSGQCRRRFLFPGGCSPSLHLQFCIAIPPFLQLCDCKTELGRKLDGAHHVTMQTFHWKETGCGLRPACVLCIREHLWAGHRWYYIFGSTCGFSVPHSFPICRHLLTLCMMCAPT